MLLGPPACGQVGCGSGGRGGGGGGGGEGEGHLTGSSLRRLFCICNQKLFIPRETVT